MKTSPIIISGLLAVLIWSAIGHAKSLSCKDFEKLSGLSVSSNAFFEIANPVDFYMGVRGKPPEQVNIFDFYPLELSFRRLTSYTERKLARGFNGFPVGDRGWRRNRMNQYYKLLQKGLASRTCSYANFLEIFIGTLDVMHENKTPENDSFRVWVQSRVLFLPFISDKILSQEEGLAYWPILIAHSQLPSRGHFADGNLQSEGSFGWHDLNHGATLVTSFNAVNWDALTPEQTRDLLNRRWNQWSQLRANMRLLAPSTRTLVTGIIYEYLHEVGGDFQGLSAAMDDYFNDPESKDSTRMAREFVLSTNTIRPLYEWIRDHSPRE